MDGEADEQRTKGRRIGLVGGGGHERQSSTADVRLVRCSLFEAQARRSGGRGWRRRLDGGIVRRLGRCLDGLASWKAW